MNITVNLFGKQYSLERLTEHCILAVAFFLPLSLNISSVFLGLGAALWLGRMVYEKKVYFRRTPFDIGIAVFVVLSAASILVSPDKFFSFYNYYNLMGRYVLLYYLVVNHITTAPQIKKLVRVLLLSAFIVSLYGFYQYFFGVNISLEWVDREQFPDLKIRVFSTLENPNLLAGFLVTMISLASGLCYTAAVPRKKLVFAFLALVFAACLVLTYSRGAWVSLLAVVGVYGLLCNRKIFWLLLILPAVMLYSHEAVLDRIMSILNPTDTSSTLRLALWESTVAMIMDKPLLGIGWGAYWLVYPDYDFFVNNTSVKIFHAHNMYLNIAAEIGLPGLFTFLALLYGHLRLALSELNMPPCWSAGITLGIVASLAGTAVNGLTDYVLFNIQLSMLYWLLNAVIIVTYLQNQRVK